MYLKVFDEAAAAFVVFLPFVTASALIDRCDLEFQIVISCVCVFRRISDLACMGGRNDTDIHAHTSTCLVGRRSLGVPIINAPLLSFSPPAQSSVSVAGREMCSSEPRTVAVASY